MSLTVKTREVDGVMILDLAGPITLGEASATLRDAVHGLVDSGSKKILLNLAEVDWLDSSGMGELVSGYAAAQEAGGSLKLVNVTKKVNDRLIITKLATVFDVQPNEASAVASFL